MNICVGIVSSVPKLKQTKNLRLSVRGKEEVSITKFNDFFILEIDAIW